MKRKIFMSLMLISVVYGDSKNEEKLGEMLFFDPILSKNKTQSCSTCHNPNHAFTDDRDNGIGSMVSLGDDGKSLGDRNTPTAAYAKFSPHFYFDDKKKKFIGGQFWDGRESGLEGQAGGPPLNPIEMAMGSKTEVIKRLRENESYKKIFEEIYGEQILEDVDKGYEALTKAIASFERTPLFSPFDSKYDRYLNGEYELTEQEELGKALFFSNNNTNCSTCHVLKGEDKKGETFSNYEYHNIGVPKNEILIQKGVVKKDFVDLGLAKNRDAKIKDNEGKFKVPTLRNIALTAPYMHNGVFSDLRTVIEFYDKYNNTDRKLNPKTGKEWDEAEVSHSVNLEDLKAKKLTDEKIDALIAFLKTLTDKKYEELVR